MIKAKNIYSFYKNSEDFSKLELKSENSLTSIALFLKTEFKEFKNKLYAKRDELPFSIDSVTHLNRVKPTDIEYQLKARKSCVLSEQLQIAIHL